MTQLPRVHDPAFDPGCDAYAADYDAALGRGIAVSGEDKDYFAQRRIAWLAAAWRARQEQPAG